MFELGKRDTAAKAGEAGSESRTDAAGSYTSAARESSAGRRDAAVIGPSIHIQGDLKGEEDLVIEGEVKGTVYLKNNNLTIGGQGKVMANVYAKTVTVEGHMEGDLYGAERVSIRKTAHVLGNIVSPRVSLEDGARLKGSVEMDPEAIQSVFNSQPGSKAAAAPSPAKPSVAAVTSVRSSAPSGRTQPEAAVASKTELAS